MTRVLDEPAEGYFGAFGGRYVPETLWHALAELAHAHEEAKLDGAFQREMDWYLREYGGRPTPLTLCKRLTHHLDGARVYLKREDLVHGGAHKFNNVMGQVMLAKRMGKRRVIAETGAGQHGVATAMACAVLGLDCEVYMGEVDTKRQALNVFRMQLMGARVIPVTSGTRTLKDAVNEALRDWVASVETTYYCLGSVVGPDPYPRLVRDFQSVIGKELREQCLERTHKLPDVAIACVGGGSNAMGTFYPLRHDATRLIGVEAGGEGIESGKHSASIARGRPGVLHGALSFLLQDVDGQVADTHSISAGLDYPAVGPEHAYYKDVGRAEYVVATDDEALEATRQLCRLEGILPALESAHAVAHAIKLAPTMGKDDVIAVTLSGRGDKDVHTLVERLGGGV